MSVALVLGALLAIACVVLVALPFLRDPGTRPEEDKLLAPNAREQRLLVLHEERDRALGALKELEADHRSGKINDEDYRAVVGSVRREAAVALRALDAELGGTTGGEANTT